jgi:hypothetical protein
MVRDDLTIRGERSDCAGGGITGVGTADRQSLRATGIAGQRLPCRALTNARSPALMRV